MERMEKKEEDRAKVGECNVDLLLRYEMHSTTIRRRYSESSTDREETRSRGSARQRGS